MAQRLENRLEGWDSKPLTGGFAELRELADGGFSGVARTGRTTLYMLNGRVVGVVGGSIDDFEDAQATVYKAPHPSLPLLFAMKERGGEQQAKYYTNDTPISQAHGQLSDAGFTGYIELSENVLSGDYYVLYYGGRSMSCAFVGNAERLEVGDEAFELADDEVGIYEVMSVDIEVTDIPDPGGAAGGAAGDQGVTGGGTADPGAGGGATEQEDAGGAAGHDTDGATGGVDQQTDGAAAGRGDPEALEGDAGREGGAGGGPPTDEGATGAGQGAGASRSRDPTAGDTSGAGAGATDRAGEGPPARTAGASDREDVDAARGESGSAPGQPGDPQDVATGGEPEGAPGGESESAIGESDTAKGGEAAADAAGTEPAEAAETDDVATGPTDAAVDSAAGESPDESRQEPHPREEAAADRAVEAASGPQGSAVTGAATASEGLPKSQTSYGELRAIPSLSPDHTAVAEPGEEAAVTGGDPAGEEAAEPSPTETATGRSGSTGVGDDSPVGASQPRSDARPGTDVAERASQAVDVDVDAGGEQEPVPEDAGTEQLRRQLAAREERIEDLETAITDLRVQRDGLTDERDRLEQEVQRLEGEVADLEAEIERLRGELADGTDGTQRLSRKDALSGTNLFVRYGSKSGGTLEDAHAGEVDREEVNENLRLEHHTQFDADEVVVEDRPFDDFLRDTIYRGFVEWIVEDLLYEIQDTGHVKGLRELYDALPQIDRAELLGDVSVRFTEDGEEYREQRSFDVVLRDRMGNPLVVANLNDSRNPADREMMETVIHNGTDVKESNESLASAMMVTSSFFKPGALEAADEAHGGGLLGRDAKDSYVKLGRKTGFHLVLVESRGGDFHVNVPEL